MHQDHIPDLPSNHHQAVDWARVKQVLRLERPARATATLCAGIALAPWWCGRVVLPLIAAKGPAAAFGLVALTAMLTAAARAGHARPLVRLLAAVLTVTAVTATFYAAPVRTLIAHWIMEN